MNRDFDPDLARVYEVFDRDHERLRAELMASLQADWQPGALPQRGSDYRRHGARWLALATSLAASVALVLFLQSGGTRSSPSVVRPSPAPGDLASTDASYVIMEQWSQPDVETDVCNILPVFNPL